MSATHRWWGVSRCCCSCLFFKQKTAYEMRISDWSSDVCSSDLIVLARLGRRELVQGSRIAVEPAEVKHIGGGDVVVERPVVSAVGPKGREALGQLDLLGALAHRVALVRQPESLVVDEAIEIALLLQPLHDLGVTPGRPVALGEDHLSLAALTGQRLGEVRS